MSLRARRAACAGQTRLRGHSLQMRWIRRAAQDQLQRPRARRMGLHLRGRRLSPVAQIVGVVAMTASAEPELRSEITCPHCGYREVEESRRTHASSSTNARDAVSCCVQRKATAACSALTLPCPPIQLERQGDGCCRRYQLLEQPARGTAQRIRNEPAGIWELESKATPRGCF